MSRANRTVPLNVSVPSYTSGDVYYVTVPFDFILSQLTVAIGTFSSGSCTVDVKNAAGSTTYMTCVASAAGAATPSTTLAADTPYPFPAGTTLQIVLTKSGTNSVIAVTLWMSLVR